MAAITIDYAKIRNPEFRAWLEENLVDVLFDATNGHNHDGVNSPALSPSAAVENGAVTNAKLAVDAVGTSNILANAIIAAKIAADAVETAKIKDANVTAGKLATDAVETAKIKNDAVTNDKLANITRGSIKVGGAADAPTDLAAKDSGKILVGDGTDLKSVAVSGDVTLAANGAVAIGAGKVTSAMLAASAAPGAKVIAAAAAAAIPVTGNGSVALEIADAVEVNTIADPTFAGQEITIACKSRAGTGARTITAASAVNLAGNTTILFDAVGETAILRAIAVGAAFKWRVVMVDGATLG